MSLLVSLLEAPLADPSRTARDPFPIALHKRGYGKAVDDDGDRHRNERERGELLADGRVHPLLECVGQIVQRADAANAKPAEQDTVHARRWRAKQAHRYR